MSTSDENKDYAKRLGYSDKEIEGKTETELWEMITTKAAERIAVSKAKEQEKAFEGIDKDIEKLVVFFEKPKKVYVSAVGQNNNPTLVDVVGYIKTKSEIIVYNNDKLYRLTTDKIIKTKKQKDDIEAEIKAKRKRKTAEAKTRKAAQGGR
jgi:hypothetical protein